MVDLKGISTYDGMPAAVGEWLESRPGKTGDVNVRFGAKTNADERPDAEDQKGRRARKKGGHSAQPPLFAGLTEAAAELQPSLILERR